MIRDEAVEAAARVFYATCGDEPELPENYDGEPDVVKDHYRSLAQPILEAAAPHMLAVARAEGWDASTKLHLHMFGRALTTNPYRSQT